MNKAAITSLLDRHAPVTRSGRSESHSLTSLSRKLLVTPAVAQAMIDRGVLKPRAQVHRGSDELLSFFCEDVAVVRRLVALSVIARTIELCRGDASAASIAAPAAVAAHVRQFEGKPKVTELAQRPEDENPSILQKVGKAAAVVGGAALLGGGAALVRGRLAAGAAQAGKLGIAGTAALGGQLLRKDVGKAASAVGSVLTNPATPDVIEILRRARAASLARMAQ